MDLSTSEGQLHITIHNADRMDLVEDGYYINIYSDKFEQTQIRLGKGTTICIMYPSPGCAGR